MSRRLAAVPPDVRKASGLPKKAALFLSRAAQPLSVVFIQRRCYNLLMPNEKADEKKEETERGEQAEKSTDESAEEEPRKKRKLPEPPGNLKKRAEWFKKRH